MQGRLLLGVSQYWVVPGPVTAARRSVLHLKQPNILLVTSIGNIVDSVLSVCICYILHYFYLNFHLYNIIGGIIIKYDLGLHFG